MKTVWTCVCFSIIIGCTISQNPSEDALSRYRRYLLKIIHKYEDDKAHYKKEFEKWQDEGWLEIDKRSHPKVYKFNGEDKTVKETFRLLQAHNSIFPREDHAKHKIIRLNIGSKTREFRLQKNPSNNILLFRDENNRPPKYELRKLNTRHKSTVAKLMLESLNANGPNQPDFDKRLKKLIKDPKERDQVISSMINFMIGSQIAEAAHPDPSHENIKEMFEILKTDPSKFATEKVNQLKKSVDILKKSGRTIGSDFETMRLLKKIESDPYTYGFTCQTFIFANEDGSNLERLRSLLGVLKGEATQNSFQENALKVLLKSTVQKCNSLKEITDEIKAKTEQNCPKNSRRKLFSVCVESDQLELVESSIEIEDGHLQFKYVDRTKTNTEIPMEIQLDPEKNIYERTIENILAEGISENSLKHSQISPKRYTPSERISITSSAIGIYGLVAGIAATKIEFTEGHYGTGSVFLAQSAHGIGKFTGVNKIASDLTKVVSKASLESLALQYGVADRVEQMSANVFESSLARFLFDIPFISFASDIVSMNFDIQDLLKTNFINKEELEYLPLKVVNLGLDLGITAFDLIEIGQPELTVIFNVIRMTIDTFYYNVRNEMRKVNWNSQLDQLVLGSAEHFVIGVAKSIADIVTGNLLRDFEYITKQHEENEAFLKQLSNISNYFSICNITVLSGTGKCVPGRIIDFHSGPMSSYAGSIDYDLHDNWTVSLCLLASGESRRQSNLCQSFRVSNITTDIVLGLGESRYFCYKIETARLFWFIPIKSEKIICGADLNANSLKGSYTGNKYDNNFIAVQKIPKSKKGKASSCSYGKMDVGFNVKHYHYHLSGKGGMDTFFLGPQSAHVTGGPGADLYILSMDASSVTINNFDNDETRDTMFIKAPFLSLKCERNMFNLRISVEKHFVTVERWFSTGNWNKYRHLLFKTKDGVIFSPEDRGLDSDHKHLVSCNPIIENKSYAKAGQNIDLQRDPFKSVISVIGSNYNDTINGNIMDNFINGYGGCDTLSGNEGQDTYILNLTSSFTIIDNYATDNAIDSVIILSKFSSLSASKDGDDLIIRVNFQLSTSPRVVKVIKWFASSDYQHAIFSCLDHVTFHIQLDPYYGDDDVSLIPYLLDYSDKQSAVNVDLGISLEFESSYINQSIISVVDSPYSDNIKGNSLGNFISCTGGNDTLEGKEGSDKYVINENCSHVTILNFDEKETQDILFVKRKFYELSIYKLNSDLILSRISQPWHQSISLKKWFAGSKYQHLILKSVDGITAVLPTNEADIREWLNTENPDLDVSSQFWTSLYNVSHSLAYYPYIVEVTQDPETCKNLKTSSDNVFHVNINLWSTDLFNGVQAINFHSPNCSYSIIGNALNNFLNPGPSLNGFESIPQYLEGTNGSDTYHLSGNHIFATINNAADDEAADSLFLDLNLEDVTVNYEKDHVELYLGGDHTGLVTLFNYNTSSLYRHIYILTADGYMFKPVESPPYKEVTSVDHSSVHHSCNISLEGVMFAKTKEIRGSKFSSNMIKGNNMDNVIYGGEEADVIYGIEGQNWIETFGGNDFVYTNYGPDSILTGDGNDTIESGFDDDVIFPGSGADIVNGGPGQDTVILQGDVSTATGVYVNLTLGYGLRGDAEGDLYFFVENIWGSHFDDVLVGDEFDNEIKAFGGDDTIVPDDGNDILCGGEGSDTYFLRGAIGFKNINNFAWRGHKDIVVVDDRMSTNLCAIRLYDDLYLHIYSHVSAEVVHDDRTLDINFLHWYHNITYRHTEFHFSDVNISDNYFDSQNENVEDMTIDIKKNVLLDFNFTAQYVSDTSVKAEWQVNTVKDIQMQCPKCTFQIVAFIVNYPDLENFPATSQTGSMLYKDGHTNLFDSAKETVLFDITKQIEMGSFEVTGLFPGADYNLQMLFSRCGVIISRSSYLSVAATKSDQ